MKALIIILAVAMIGYGIFLGLKSSSHVKSGERDKYFGLAVLSFIIPLIGLIVYAVSIDTNPEKAKRAGGAAVFGLVLGLIASVLFALKVI